jgi:plasmid replication initiation protein
MELEKASKREKLITQDNELVEACYRMDVNEKRLIMLGISKINPMSGIPDASKPFKFEITAKEWEQAYGDQNAWRAVKRTADKLLSRQITLHPKTNVVEKLNWFDRVKYFLDEGRIEVQFTRSVQIRLAGMLEQFTTIDLFAVNKLRSFYSIRLYEILSQFEGRGHRRMSVDDFRHAMDCVNINPQTKDLKRRILNPAIKELNKQSDIHCVVKDIKDGRKITHFDFKFNKKPQQALL